MLEKQFNPETAPEEPRDMTLRPTGSGAQARYPLSTYSTSRMEWIGKDGSARIPRETSKKHHTLLGFEAAGKRYLSTGQLCAKLDEEGIWGRDIYGREVFCVRERFPCFDSYDYLNENRFYRWWFIREGNRLTRIHATDGQEGIFVTEDVQDLENMCWEEMRRQGYCCEK